MINEFFGGNADIIIGTQIISKGFDTENIGLIGIILADSSLQIPDFRANEKTFALLHQVIGRMRKEGEVVIQTFLKDNKIFEFLKNGNYKEFYESEIQERKKFALPPFVNIAKNIFRHIDKKKAFLLARKMQDRVKKLLKKDEKVFVSVPLIPFKHGKYHTQVLIYSKNIEKLLSKINLSGGILDLNPVRIV